MFVAASCYWNTYEMHEIDREHVFSPFESVLFVLDLF